MSDEVAEWCGYNSTWDMLTYHLDKEELINLLQEFVYEDKQGWIAEIIEDLAKQHYDWVDHEKIRADHEDRMYQEYKDKIRGIE